MCGIVGIWNRSKQIDKNLLTIMRDSLKHRGPDDKGIFIDNQVGLAHRRLSIIDLSKAGHQPMYNEDKSIWITYNGEIYNYIEIKQKLKKRGHIFHSNTDTEVIIHAYEEYGIDCLQLFNGMFAFALWDKHKKEMFLARDRAGQKPLVYYKDKDKFIFASEIQAILKDKSIKRKINKNAINLYFTLLYVPSPFTMFQGIYKLPPASYMIVKDNKIKIKKYWNLELKEINYKEKEIINKIKYFLEQSIKRRLISDVPLGIFLSGGLDSSSIVAFMSKLIKKIDTFSAGFGNLINELPYAKIVSKQFKTNHHEKQIRANVEKILKKIVRYYGEPFADSSNIPVYLLSELTSKHIKVALGGDGGDELFGGYERYKNYLFDKGKPLNNKIPSCQSLDDDTRKNLFKFDIDNSLNELVNCHLISEDPNDIKNLFKFDFEIRLPDQLLTKVDIASMIFSLEVRAPFLDHELIEFVASIPCKIKLGFGNNFELKKIFKKVIRKYNLLPNKLIDRKKQGFGAPVTSWLRKDLKEFTKEILFDDNACYPKYLNKSYIQTKFKEFYLNKFNNGYFFWKIIVFELWLREFKVE